MKKASKATVKKLEKIVKAAKEKPYFNDKEMIAYNFLEWINRANKNTENYEECKKYDAMEEFKADGKCHWSIDNSLVLDNLLFGEKSNTMCSMDYSHHDLVNYSTTLDLNICIIKDVNKLLKRLEVIS